MTYGVGLTRKHSASRLPFSCMDVKCKIGCATKGCKCSMDERQCGADLLNVRAYLEKKVLILITMVIWIILFNPPFPMQIPHKQWTCPNLIAISQMMANSKHVCMYILMGHRQYSVDLAMEDFWNEVGSTELFLLPQPLPDNPYYHILRRPRPHYKISYWAWTLTNGS